MTAVELRRALIQVFKDSASMPGNERAFREALRAYEDKLLDLDTMTEVLAARSRDKS